MSSARALLGSTEKKYGGPATVAEVHFNPSNDNEDGENVDKAAWKEQYW